MCELFKVIALKFFLSPYVNARGLYKRRAWSRSPTLRTAQFRDVEQYRCIEII